MWKMYDIMIGTHLLKQHMDPHFYPPLVLLSIVILAIVIFFIGHGRKASRTSDVAVDAHRGKRMYFLLSQSGGGKDTQAAKLLGWLQEYHIKYLYVSIGEEVRGTIADLGAENLFAKTTIQISDQGKLQPAVVPIFFFLRKFLEKYTGRELIIVNGSPRSESELVLWSTMISAGYIPEATIIHLDVNDDECRERLKKRPGRPDTDDEKTRETKLAWYAPIRKMLKRRLPVGIDTVTIDGSLSPDEVQAELRDFFQMDGVVKQ